MSGTRFKRSSGGDSSKEQSMRRWSISHRASNRDIEDVQLKSKNFAFAEKKEISLNSPRYISRPNDVNESDY